MQKDLNGRAMPENGNKGENDISGLNMKAEYQQGEDRGISHGPQSTQDEPIVKGEAPGKDLGQIPHGYYAAEEGGLQPPMESPESPPEPRTLLDDMIDYFSEMGVFKNMFTGQVFTGSNEFIDDSHLSTMYILCRKKFGKEVKKGDVKDILNGCFLPHVNPVREAFLNYSRVESDGELDRFLKCLKYRKNSPEEFINGLIVKWLMQLPAMAIDEEYPRLVWVIIGPSHIGKSTLFRNLLPKHLRSYYAESELNRGKDSNVLMSLKLILNIDEFGGLAKGKPELFKLMVSSPDFYDRPAYGHYNTRFIRRAVLCGTSNSREIICDTTAKNSRIIPCWLEDIDREALNQIDRIRLMAEVTRLYLERGKVSIRLDHPELEVLGQYSETFQGRSIEFDLIGDYVEPGGTFHPTSEIIKHLELNLGRRFSEKAIKKVLFDLGVEQDRIRVKEWPHPLRGYYVNLISGHGDSKG